MASLSTSVQFAQTWGWVRWELPRFCRQWGARPGAWALFLALGLLLNGAAWQWSLKRESERALRAAALALHAEQTGARVAKPMPNQASTLVDSTSFDAVLVNDAQWSNVLHDLLSSAQAKGVDVLSGDYSVQTDAGNGFLRRRIGMPVRGEAKAIRVFIEDNLRRHPGLAIQALQFKRGAVGEANVDARLDWVLLSRPAQDGKVQP